MACDMVVALGRATVNGQTIFGQNTHNRPGECEVLRRFEGRHYALGEMLRFSSVQLPQARQTFTVLGSQPRDGWGLSQGINEHQVAVGCGSWRSRLAGANVALAGTDLVRLALERCRSAHQALDFLTDTVSRHGASDNVFLVADANEAFVVETTGNHWASLQCTEVRAVVDASLIRQDWSRLAHGLAELAIASSWWPDDGRKLDFAASVGLSGSVDAGAMKRWGRATWLLQQQNGRIDASFVRMLFSDHFEGTGSEVDPSGTPTPGVVPLCRHHASPTSHVTAGSMVCQLSRKPTDVPMAWYAFGPPCACIFFPIFLDGDLPDAFTQGGAQTNVQSLWWQTQQLLSLMSRPERWAALREDLSNLQQRIELEAEEFLEEAAALKQRGEKDSVRRLAGLLMQNHVEQFEAEVQRQRRLDAPQVAALETARPAN